MPEIATLPIDEKEYAVVSHVVRLKRLDSKIQYMVQGDTMWKTVEYPFSEEWLALFPAMRTEEEAVEVVEQEMRVAFGMPAEKRATVTCKFGNHYDNHNQNSDCVDPQPTRYVTCKRTEGFHQNGHAEIVDAGSMRCIDPKPLPDRPGVAVACDSQVSGHNGRHTWIEGVCLNPELLDTVGYRPIEPAPADEMVKLDPTVPRPVVSVGDVFVHVKSGGRFAKMGERGALEMIVFDPEDEEEWQNRKS